jgi:aldose 1-epimerase
MRPLPLLTLTRGTARSAAQAAARLRKRPVAGVATAAVLALGVTGSLAMGQAPATSGNSCHPTISKQFFGTAIEPFTGKPAKVFRYTLTNCRGMQAKIITYGATQQSITVPGRNGRKADVILGFKTLKDYVNFDSPPPPATGGPYFGETIGRYGNRIAKGTFQLQQSNGLQTYTLPINNNGNSLHGGFVGFGNHIWSAHIVKVPHAVGVAMTLVSPDGDEGSAFEPSCNCTGYPGKLTLTVTFTLNNANQLAMHYHATVQGKNTVINFTNHNYFNLAGESSFPGSAYGQFVQINANRYLPTNTTQIPTGVEARVAGTPFDFRRPHTIGSRIDDVTAPDNGGGNQLLIAQGYDHNWVLNKQTPATTGPLGLNLAARAFDLRSGRSLTVWTDQPGVQFYSGNFLNGTLVGISGHTYRQSAGYTFETQHFPDSPNQPNFPSTELKVGQVFNSTTIYQFGS